jgi:hypothetical protein
MRIFICSGLLDGLRHQFLIVGDDDWHEGHALDAAFEVCPSLKPTLPHMPNPYCRQLHECGDGPVYVLDELALDLMEHVGDEWALSAKDRNDEADEALGERLNAEAKGGGTDADQ